MAIGTPAQLGNTNNTAGGSTFPVSGSTLGDAIIIGISLGDSSASVSFVSDNAGNTYSRAVKETIPGTGRSTEIWYALNTVVPTSIRIGTTSGLYRAQAISCSGIVTAGALDRTNVTFFTSSTSTSLSTGALNQSSELIFVAFAGPGYGTWTEGAGFTSNTPFGAIMRTAYQIVASSAPVTWAPSWALAASGSACIATFDGSTVSPPAPFLMPQGVM